eukprot:236166-Chlamydomonas_euryale.AAC.1
MHVCTNTTQSLSCLHIQDKYVEELSSSVYELANHWKAEAERQAQLSRTAGSAEFVARNEKLQVGACDVRGVAILRVAALRATVAFAT